MNSPLPWPTLDEVYAASREQLGRWYRFLPGPQDDAQGGIIQLICRRFQELGGWSPDLSKRIGWDALTPSIPCPHKNGG